MSKEETKNKSEAEAFFRVTVSQLDDILDEVKQCYDNKDKPALERIHLDLHNLFLKIRREKAPTPLEKLEEEGLSKLSPTPLEKLEETVKELEKRVKALETPKWLMNDPNWTISNPLMEQKEHVQTTLISTGGDNE